MGHVPADLVSFCEREFPRLVGALELYVGDLQAAEDLAQEALLRACHRWPRVGSLDSPGGWVHRVAINLATSHLRRRQVRRRIERHLAIEEPIHLDPHADLDLRRAVARLPDRQRAAVVLHYFLDHRVSDVAELIGVPAGTVKSDLHQARATLGRTITEEALDGR